MSSPTETQDGAAPAAMPTAEETADSSNLAAIPPQDMVTREPVAQGTMHEINANLHVCVMSDGTYASFADGHKMTISEAVYETLLQGVANRPTRPRPPSDISNITGLRSASAAMTNDEPIEWGDMDPNLVRELQQNPAKMKVFLATHKSKQPRLEYQRGGAAFVPPPEQPSSSSIGPTPPLATETPAFSQLQADSMTSWFEKYHHEQISPLLARVTSLETANLPEKFTHAERQARLDRLASLSVHADTYNRTCIVHGIPPFSNYRTIQDNLYYLLGSTGLSLDDLQSMTNHLLTTTSAFLKLTFVRESQARQFFQSFRQKKRYFRQRDTGDDVHVRVERDLAPTERIERQPLLAVVDCLTKIAPPGDPSPLYTEYLRTDFNSLQLWNPEDDSLLAQILYAQDSAANIVCHLGILPSHKTHILNTFGGALQSRMHDTLRFLQASANASRHRSTNVRFHYSNAQDISNISPSEALKYFPYEIRPLELTQDMQDTLAHSPQVLMEACASSGGLQAIIQQAMQDRGISHSDFGKGSKQKGNRPSRPERHDAQEETQEFAPRKGNKGKGKRQNQAGFAPQDSYTIRRGDWQPQNFDTNYQWQPPPANNASQWGPPSSLPSWGAQPVPAPVATRPGWGQRQQWSGGGGKNNSLLDDSTLSSNLIQCDDCSALLGTNSSCLVCTNSSHLEILQQFQRFEGLEAFDQPIVEWFACPFFVPRPDGSLPSCNTSNNQPCYCCITWDSWATRFYSGSLTAPEANPIMHSLMAAYERAVLELLENPVEIYQQYKTSYSDIYKLRFPDSVVSWWYMILNDSVSQNDPLDPLPKPWKHSSFANQSPSLLSQPPAFHQLSYPVKSCNIQDTSKFLSIIQFSCDGFADVLRDSFELPDFTVVSCFQYFKQDLITLDIVPWHSMVRESFRWAFQDLQIAPSFSVQSVEEIVYAVLSNRQDYLLDQFCKTFCFLLSKYPELMPVFLGQLPYSNEPLKKLAAAGSSYFDTVYHNLAALYNLHTTASQTILAPNTQFCEIYDLIVKTAPTQSPLHVQASSALARHWNNKGNSLESLALLLAERGEHAFIITQAWLILQLAYKDHTYPWIAQYLVP